jgi:pimeloyl-ACP methyl ester carboxylesterase
LGIILNKRLAVVTAVAMAVCGMAYVFRASLEVGAAFVKVRPIYKDVRIGDATARIYLPSSYKQGDKGRGANLYLHGNGHSHAVFLGAEALQQIKDGEELFAVIDGQDHVAPPFQSAASGWGNHIYKKRYLDLYAYLREHYGIDEKVDVIAASMGGLAMGRLIVERPFPIARAYGLGPVPYLQTIFDRGGDKRKLPIRNAYGLRLSGDDDAMLHQVASDAFWIDHLASAKGKLPPLKIIAGTGDDVFKIEFGGSEAYRQLCRTYRQSGGQCSYSEVDGVGHDHNIMIPAVLAEALVKP